MSSIPPDMRRQVWRRFLVPLALALLVGVVWAAPAAMQEPAPKPVAHEICGHPYFEDAAGRLGRTVAWRPLPKEDLRAQGKLDSQGHTLADYVGQRRTFWASDFQDGTFYSLTATCARVGTHAYIYVEDGQDVDGSVLDRIRDEFDSTIYPKDTSVFGSEPRPGVDGDERVYLLLLDIRDGWNGTTVTGYIAGYFHSLNEYPNADLPADERYSNEKEMIYIDLNPAQAGSEASLGTVAHEFQHMIHWWMDSGHDEETWVNEGCSDLAQYVCGYGYPRSHLVTGSPSSPGFLEKPDHQLTLTGPAWSSPTNKVLASYGASFMWTLYLWEHYGGDDTIRRLVGEQANGIQGVNDALAAVGTGDRFEQVFRRWAAANYLDDGEGALGYRSIELLDSGYDNITTFPRPVLAATHASYPVATSRTVNYWAANAVKLPGVAEGAVYLGFNGADDNRFAATVIRSWTGNFAPGSNLAGEIVLNGAGDGQTMVLSTGGASGAVLLIPASLGESGGKSYSYTASLGPAPAFNSSAYLPMSARPERELQPPTPQTTPTATPSPTPTPTPSGPLPGYWYDGTYTEFYVTADRNYVRDYRIWVTIPGCGVYYIQIDSMPISSGRFSYNWSDGFSMISVQGVFNSATSAAIANRLVNYPFLYCGYRSGGPWYSTATWRNPLLAPPARPATEPPIPVPATPPPGAGMAPQVLASE